MTMAANSSDDFSQVISEEVTCPVCTEEFKEPKMLNCYHNVCKECLKGMFRNKRFQDIECPVCRKPTHIPKGLKGVRCLPTNAAIVRVVEATLARKARVEIHESLETGRSMVKLLANKISDFDNALRVLGEIHGKADTLVDAIRNQEASLCREVEEFYGIKNETIKDEKSDLDNLHSSASRSVKEAETILRETRPDYKKTIKAAKVLREQIERIIELDRNRDMSSTREDLQFESRPSNTLAIIGIIRKKFGKLTSKRKGIFQLPPLRV